MITSLVFTLMVGTAWSFLGLGFLSLHFHYLPEGPELVGQALGLFLAGTLSGFFLLGLQAGNFTPTWRPWIGLNYVLFAPVGLLIGLLIPGTMGYEGAGFSATTLIAMPFAITLLSNAAMVTGLGFMGWVGASMHNVALRIQPAEPQLSPFHLHTPQPQPERVRF